MSTPFSFGSPTRHRRSSGCRCAKSISISCSNAREVGQAPDQQELEVLKSSDSWQQTQIFRSSELDVESPKLGERFGYLVTQRRSLLPDRLQVGPMVSFELGHRIPAKLFEKSL